MRWCVWLGLCLLGCSSPKGEGVKVFVAASARDALREIADDFQAKHGVGVQLNAEASSVLARQIEQGADADLFLSADEAWADYLAKNGLVAERHDLLANRLVVVVNAADPVAIHALADLAGNGVGRLALAGKEVPAGRYAREALRKAGAWEQVKDRVVQAANVRAALTYVARGEAEAGLVYATDAASTTQVKVAVEVKADLHEPIRYPLVLVKRTPLKDAARSLYDFLFSDAAAERFRKHGFEVVR